MARLPLALPPGVFSDGTDYQGKGRWASSWGVRWYGPALGPIGGFRIKNGSTSALTGSARAALAWKDNSANSWLGIGTHSKLYVSNVLGAIFDVTPTVGFTSGRATATGAGGYGSGTFGSSTYGTPRPGTTEIVDATQWTLAAWGQDLLAVSPDDGKLRQWVTASGTGVVAATVTNSPACKAVCVTAERFVFALATTDPRTVSWCDQEANTVWTPSTTNQAGSFPLDTKGRLMCGAGVKGATLLLTDLGVHAATYIGGTAIYSFDKVGDNCGAISRQAAAPFGNQQLAWMSNSGFWQWNGGSVLPIRCDVYDYIHRDINLLLASKIVAVPNSAYSEIEFRYCSTNSTEIDRCVVWNHKFDYWVIGRPTRTCGVDMGVFQYPLLISSTGYIYEHEVGWAYGSDTPYAVSGPIELGDGDNIMEVTGMYPDDITVGDVTATFTARRNQDSPSTTYGPYSLTEKTDLRFSGGIVEMTVTGSAMDDWRVGIPKLNVVPGAGRG